MNLWAVFGSAVNAWKQSPKISLSMGIGSGYTKPMNLKLERLILDDKGTIGSLYCDGVFICHTLEDPARTMKIYGKTCIPYGIYPVDFTWSNRFSRLLPLLADVPLFSAIRIHGGRPETTTKDTEGCPLTITSYHRSPDGWVGSGSKDALALVCEKFAQNPTGGHKIEIVGGYSAKEMSNANP